MPRKIDLEVETVVKPKRQITDAQREHLNKIRLLAMAKKAELKEITLKSKLAKTVPKQELAKQYDEYIAHKAVKAVKPKPDPEPEFGHQCQPAERDPERWRQRQRQQQLRLRPAPAQDSAGVVGSSELCLDGPNPGPRDSSDPN